jgi:hypothetical protein
MKQVLKKLFIFALIASSFIGLLFYCSSRIDEKRKEEKERKEKIEEGTCEFDRVDLENLKINYNRKSFKSVLDFDSLKLKFYDQLAKLAVNNTDTSYTLKSIRVDNTIFTFYVKGRLAAVKSIELDFSSQFSFSINDSIAFTPEYKLDDFKAQYPKSYACRLNHATSWKKEEHALKIDNTNYNSKFKYIVFYFNNAENLVYLEFYYDFENNE